MKSHWIMLLDFMNAEIHGYPYHSFNDLSLETKT